MNRLVRGPELGLFRLTQTLKGDFLHAGPGSSGPAGLVQTWLRPGSDQQNMKTEGVRISPGSAQLNVVMHTNAKLTVSCVIFFLLGPGPPSRIRPTSFLSWFCSSKRFSFFLPQPEEPRLVLVPPMTPLRVSSCDQFDASSLINDQPESSHFSQQIHSGSDRSD